MSRRQVLWVGFFLLITISTFAQPGRRATSYADRTKQFLQTQWWLGFRAGANLSAYDPVTRYSGFSPVNYEAGEKEYEDFQKIAGGAGLDVTFYHRGFSFSIQPNFRRQTFSYSNDFLWEDPDNPDNSLELQYDQTHELDYIEIPLFVKYDITTGKIRPFVQVGAYYATLIDANKEVVITGTDFASGDAGPFEAETKIIGARDLFTKSSIGLAGGVGASYDIANIRVLLDLTYRHGLNNLTNVKNRFSSNELAGIGDALDDLELRNITLNLGILFPLRYLSSGTAIN